MIITMKQLYKLVGRSSDLIGDEGPLEFTLNPWYGDGSGHVWIYLRDEDTRYSFEIRESDEEVEVIGRSFWVTDSEGEEHQITPLFTVDLEEYIDRNPL